MVSIDVNPNAMTNIGRQHDIKLCITVLGTSLMIDVGQLPRRLSAVDVVGMQRISSAAPDIGAFEYNADIIFRSGYLFLQPR